MKDPELSHTPVHSFIQTQSANTEPAEHRLKSCLTFMRDCLSQNKDPDFKGFWEVRQFCFPLFKEPLSKQVRADLWNQYTDLTREGRRLKSILDSESSFAAEQIDLAIQDLEQQVLSVLDQGSGVMTTDFVVPSMPQALKNKGDLYAEMQKLLHCLNLFVTRIQGLRAELMKTPMRIKQKNGLFNRLSSLGDRVFPLRKELMKNVNQEFTAAVKQFADAHFSEANFSPEKIRKQVFFFRNEIKLFQALAKFFTLDTHSFTETRNQLSQCWDCLKGMEKELKKEHAEHKQQSTANVAQVKQKIEEVSQAFNDGTLLPEQACAKLDFIQQEMRQVSLLKVDVQYLKSLIAEVMQPIQEKRQQLQNERLQQERLIDAQKRQQVTDFEAKLCAFIEQMNPASVQGAAEQLAQMKQEMRGLPAMAAERQRIDSIFKQARDKLLELQETVLLDLPQESRQLLEEWTACLNQRKSQRLEIKAQLDEYRKVLAGSSLDIEKIMTTQELLAREKEVLEKCDLSISEIEKKIKDLKHSR